METSAVTRGSRSALPGAAESRKIAKCGVVAHPGAVVLHLDGFQSSKNVAAEVDCNGIRISIHAVPDELTYGLQRWSTLSKARQMVCMDGDGYIRHFCSPRGACDRVLAKRD